MVIFSSNTVRIEKDQDGTIMVVMDAKGDPVNKVNLSMLRDLDAGLDKLAELPLIPVVILRSGKTSGFAFGPDLDEWQSLQSLGNVSSWQDEAMRVFKRLKEFKAPTIAAISGPCVGAGLELALACDYRLVYERPNTLFAFPEVELGACPALGSLFFLVKKIGLQQVLKLVVLGARWKVEEIFQNGLADAKAQTEQQLRSEFTRLTGIAMREGKKNNLPSSNFSLKSFIFENNFAKRAITLRAFGRILSRNNPEEIQGPRQTMELLSDLSKLKKPELGQQKIAELFTRLLTSPACINLINFTKEDISRIPEFPSETPFPRRVALMGEGKTSAEWAFLHASRGVQVSILAKSPTGLGNTLLAINNLMNETIRKGIWSVQEVSNRMNMIQGIAINGGNTSQNFSEKIDLAFILDPIFLNSSHLEGMKKNQPNCLFVNGTSDPSILNNTAYLLQQYPLGRYPCAELVIQETSSIEERNFLLAWVAKLGKTAVLPRETNFSLGAKILFAGLTENIELLGEGLPLSNLENSMRSWGFTAGPLFWADWIGLNQVKQLHNKYSPLNSDFTDLFGLMQSRQWLGIDEGKGWFLHRKNSWWPNLLAQNLVSLTLKRSLDPVSKSMSVGNRVREGRERILFAMLIEFTKLKATYALKEESDWNFLAVRGIGWPAFRGGPGPWIRLKGIPYWEALSKSFSSRFGPKFDLPQSWTSWFQ